MIKIEFRYNYTLDRTTLKIRKNSIKKEEIAKLINEEGFNKLPDKKGTKDYIITYEGPIKDCEKLIKKMFVKEDNQ